MNWTALAAFALATAVGIGAFGAHGLKDHLDAYSMGVYEKGVIYHFIHALGLLSIGVLMQMKALRQNLAGWAAWLLLSGILLFSGSLYVLAITGNRMWGAVTPLGGVAFIAGWILLALSALREQRPKI